MLRQTQQLKSNNSKKVTSNSHKNSSNLVLLPGDVKSFHFPSKLNEKILQMKTVKTKKMVNEFFGNISKAKNKNNNSNKNNYDGNKVNKKINYYDKSKNNNNNKDDNFDDTSDDDSNDGKKSYNHFLSCHFILMLIQYFIFQSM